MHHKEENHFVDVNEMVSIASVLRESEREEAKANDQEKQEKEVDQIAHGFGPPFKYKCEVGTTPFLPSLIPSL